MRAYRQPLFPQFWACSSTATTKQQALPVLYCDLSSALHGAVITFIRQPPNCGIMMLYTLWPNQSARAQQPRSHSQRTSCPPHQPFLCCFHGAAIWHGSYEATGHTSIPHGVVAFQFWLRLRFCLPAQAEMAPVLGPCHPQGRPSLSLGFRLWSDPPLAGEGICRWKAAFACQINTCLKDFFFFNQ